MTDRVVALVDMDCFYCQVETRLNPEWKGLPLAVVQYNEWKGGGIIAVNYEARDKGVTRFMRGDQAKEQCPEIILAKVPTLRDKADLTRYREAGREVVAVLSTFSECVERASVDEAYVDLSAAVEQRIALNSSHVSPDDLANTFVVGYSIEKSNNEDERVPGLKSWLSDVYDNCFQHVAAQKLAVGAAIVEEMRKAVYDKTGFRCSAGIAHNKILAKLGCGLHKPNRQTVVPHSSIPGLYKTLPARKVRSLGGKLGDDLAKRLDVKFMADLLKFSENDLQKIYDTKTGTWLYNIARGYDYEPVTPRLLSKSIGCCKRFPGRNALKSSLDVNHWITKLAEELLDRLIEDQQMNKRRAQLLTISMGLEINQRDSGSTKSVGLTGYNLEKIMTLTYNALRKFSTEDPKTKLWSPPVKFLGLSAGKFINETANKINNFFKTTPESGEVNTLKIKKREDPCSSLSLALDKTSQLVTSVLNKMEAQHNSYVRASAQTKSVLKAVDTNEATEELDKDQHKEVKQPSFFEKMLFQGASNNERKLNILPSLNRFEGQTDDDNSKDSCSSEKLSHSNNHSNSLPQKEISIEEQKHYEQSNPNQNNKKVEICSNNTEPLQNKSKSSKKTISSFFSLSALNEKQKWTSPEEIFPDLQNIDDDVVDMFPPSFRKKILELKSKSIENCNTDACNDAKENVDSLRVEENSTTEEANSLNSDDPNVSNETKQLDFTKCNECGENIPLSDREIHLDLHVAMKLDNELNHPLINHVVNPRPKNCLNIQPNTKRKTKSNLSNKTTKKIKSIEAFFVK